MTPGVLLSKADTADLSFVIGSYITEVHTDNSQTPIFAHELNIDQVCIR